MPDPTADATPPPLRLSDPLLPEQTNDDTDAGWGEARASEATDLRRLLDEVPPHHG